MLIGATSWQINGSYLENVEHIGKNIQFCELLIYTWNKRTEEILSREIDKITNKTKITLHLPTDKLENVKAAYEFFKDQDYFHITLHPFINFKQFADFYFSISEGVENGEISIENPENDIFFEFCDYLKEEAANIYVTMDYGHLLLDKRSVNTFYKRFSNQITEIHFHGANDKKSHCYPDQKTIDDFTKFMEDNKFGTDFPVCIELFNMEDTKRLAEDLKSK